MNYYLLEWFVYERIVTILYICFALLVDLDIQNEARKIVYDLSEKYKISLVGSRLPQHISLKQSFKVSIVDDVEKYFCEFAKRIEPFEIEISAIELISVKNEDKENQILWYKVCESKELRELHNRLNKELKHNLNIAMNGFDGSQWRFHSTIAYGLNPQESFKEYEEKNRKNIFKVSKIAMFYSPDNELIADNFMTYKVLRLG